MKENKSLAIVKENIFVKIFKKFKNIFIRNTIENNELSKNVNSDIVSNSKVNMNQQKNEFLRNIKIKEDTGIIYLKIKLENNEIRAIDLTDEQIDKLQQIYDKEIQQKQNKINKLKKVS